LRICALFWKWRLLGTPSKKDENERNEKRDAR
jgi:hypothetical protein